MVTHPQKEVNLAEININADTARVFFDKIMRRAIETNARGDMYNGINNSCTNNPVELLNPLLPRKQRTMRNMFAATLPATAVHAYAGRGAIKPFAQHIDFGPSNHSRPMNFDAFNPR
jgi:hypothetical protein